MLQIMRQNEKTAGRTKLCKTQNMRCNKSDESQFVKLLCANKFAISYSVDLFYCVASTVLLKIIK